MAQGSGRPKAVGTNVRGQSAVVTANENGQAVDWDTLLTGIAGGKIHGLEYGANRIIFRQGDPADAVLYVRKGKVKISVTSQQGKEAIVSILGPGECLGEPGRPTVTHCVGHRGN